MFLLIGLLCNISYEIIIYKLHIPITIYRLLLFRYLFLIFSGTYIVDKHSINKYAHSISIIIGGLIVYSINYTNFEWPIIKYWVDTSMLCSAYIIPIVHILIKTKIHSKVMEFIGKASYNIFLIQMFYYFTIEKLLIKYINNLKIEIPLSIIICLILGIIFYFIEQKITTKILNIFRKKEGK